MTTACRCDFADAYGNCCMALALKNQVDKLSQELLILKESIKDEVTTYAETLDHASAALCTHSPKVSD